MGDESLNLKQDDEANPFSFKNFLDASKFELNSTNLNEIFDADVIPSPPLPSKPSTYLNFYAKLKISIV